MDLFDIFDIPVVVDTMQLLMFVLAFFLFGLIFLVVIIFGKGYQLNRKYIEANLSGAITAIVLFGMALGIFVIAMILSPGYVTVPFGANEKLEMFTTLGVIGFLTSIIAMTFLYYTKRGGF